MAKQILVSMLVTEADFIRTWQFARKVAIAATCKNQAEINDTLSARSKAALTRGQQEGKRLAQADREQRGVAF